MQTIHNQVSSSHKWGERTEALTLVMTVTAITFVCVVLNKI